MIYDFVCRSCGSTLELEKGLVEYAAEGFTTAEISCSCGDTMVRKLSAPTKLVRGVKKGEHNSTNDLKWGKK